MSEGVFAAFGRLLRSPAFKLGLVAFLVLLLGVPLLSVWALVGERKGRSREAAAGVARNWGDRQALTGPFLVVPYTVEITVVANDKQIQQPQTRYGVFLPDQATFAARAATQVLHRGIFDVPVYSSDLTASGHFEAPDIAKIEPMPATVHWADAVLALGLSDVSGLKQASALSVSGRGNGGFEPSIGVANAQMNGIHARLADVAGAGGSAAAAGPVAAFDYTFKLGFTGSLGLTFAPVGRETTVAISSDWPSPSFTGDFLPVDRTVAKDGFTATWKIPHLARSVPQAWSEGEANFNVNRIAAFQSGADLFVPVDFYDLVGRALKYGLMFPAVVFMAVFIMEVLSRQKLHPVQYAFTGAALVLFFVLLLSFAEHIGFLSAYLLAGAATSLLVAAYIWRAMDSLARGGVALLVLLVLYGLLYFILRLEDYALLAGALAGFAMLAAAMFLTLGVDWSGKAPITDNT